MPLSNTLWPAQKENKLFWSFLALHISLWTLLPSLLNANLPLDVIEALAWGREWEWGFPKHPPMSAWLAEIAGMVSGGADWGLYLLSQVCIGVAFWAMWQLSKDFLKPLPALVAILLLESIAYHNLTSPEFNVNVSLLAFWALTILTFWRALDRQSIPYWMACGLFAAMGFLSKYLIVFLLIPLLFFLLLHRESRGVFRNPGIYLGLGVFVLVIAPHLVWIWQNEFITITYGLRRAGSSAGAVAPLSDHLVHPLKFLASQLVLLLPTMLLLWALGSIKVKPSARHLDRQTRFLLFAFLGPFACYLLLSSVTGMQIRSMWGTPLFILSGLFLVRFLALPTASWRFNRFGIAWGVVALLFLSLYASAYLFSPAIKERGKRTHFPGKELAAQVTQQWHAAFNRPLEFVIGDEWLGGNVGWYSSDRPSVFLNADTKQAPWASNEKIRQSGGVILWQAPAGSITPDERLNLYRERFGNLQLQSPFILDWNTPTPIKKLHIGWALVPPLGAR
ncbi:glycosyltransferase family 39 protein [Solemya velesiana gill symbiont]|uniref:Glycosyltransferase RgtA/B/C/D-like domain-containing protein n=1 Tax=Solemya velesiana gill symbiont TaxID=1918948 RepID=A0A1T2KUD9_9GAMM|nr:glycosyltransferase family 39 protein [Solemya velesiana gill symbiont]OOZ36465.1 hypothetical protein BOW51_07055 [Solemya velesiana gill symbiont]